MGLVLTVVHCWLLRSDEINMSRTGPGRTGLNGCCQWNWRLESRDRSVPEAARRAAAVMALAAADAGEEAGRLEEERNRTAEADEQNPCRSRRTALPCAQAGTWRTRPCLRLAQQALAARPGRA